MFLDFSGVSAFGGFVFRGYTEMLALSAAHTPSLTSASGAG
jgi:hypothetical protein